jgi:hypothetical protein
MEAGVMHPQFPVLAEIPARKLVDPQRYAV